MLFKSGLLTQASGSLGGCTFAHCMGGMYIRARSVPVNPNTQRQLDVRNAVAGLSEAWNTTLSAAEREAWGVYAAATPVINKLGDSIHLSGQQMYLRCNTIRKQVTARTADFVTPTVWAVVDAAPSTPGVATAVASLETATETAGAVVITLNLAGAFGDDGDAILQVGPLLSAGRSYFKGPYQLANVAAVAAAATQIVFNVADVTDPEEWLADAVPVIGAILPIRVRTLFDDGKIGPEFMRLITIASGA